MASRRRAPPEPIRADRVRAIQGSFAFLQSRFLHDGFLAQLTHAELALYVFLVLAADRRGVSYYTYDRICETVHLTVDAYVQARNALIQLDLLAFDGTYFQVLSLPDRPLRRRHAPRPASATSPASPREDRSPTSLGQALRVLLDDA